MLLPKAKWAGNILLHTELALNVFSCFTYLAFHNPTQHFVIDQIILSTQQRLQVLWELQNNNVSVILNAAPTESHWLHLVGILQFQEGPARSNFIIDQEQNKSTLGDTVEFINSNHQ